MQALTLDGVALTEWPGETHSCSETKRRGRWAFKKNTSGSASRPAHMTRSASTQWSIINGRLKMRRLGVALLSPGRAERKSSTSSHDADNGGGAGGDEDEDDEDGGHDDDDDESGRSEEEVHVHHPMLSAFETARAQKNRELSGMGEPELQVSFRSRHVSLLIPC